MPELAFLISKWTERSVSVPRVLPLSEEVLDDGNGEIKYWNHAAEKLFGYAAKETLHRNCYKLLEGRGVLGINLGRIPFNLRASDKGTRPNPNFDLEVKTRSGKRVWVNVSSIVSEDSRTSPRLIVHFAHDISELKRRDADEESRRTCTRTNKSLEGTCRYQGYGQTPSGCRVVGAGDPHFAKVGFMQTIAGHCAQSSYQSRHAA
jgi:PAS domain S-box-containing protein